MAFYFYLRLTSDLGREVQQRFAAGMANVASASYLANGHLPDLLVPYIYQLNLPLLIFAPINATKDLKIIRPQDSDR